MDLNEILGPVLQSNPTLALILVFFLLCTQGPTILTLWFLTKTNTTVVDRIVTAIEDMRDTIQDLANKLDHVVYRVESIEKKTYER